MMRVATFAALAVILRLFWVHVVTSDVQGETVLGFLLPAIAREPDRAVFETDTLLWARRLREQRHIFREEYEHYVKTHRLPQYHLSMGEDSAPEWDAVWLSVHGIWLSACSHFPLSTTFLRSLPNVRSAMFSRLNAGGVIPPHHGLTRITTRYQLHLIIPPVAPHEKLVIVVKNSNGTVFEHAYDGDDLDVLWDDTFLHSAINTTPHDRVVLVLDVERVDIRWYMRPLYNLFVFLSTSNEGVQKFARALEDQDCTTTGWMNPGAAVA